MSYIIQKASQIAEKIPYLKMLVLFGSRARENTHSNSDWDFAVLYDNELRKQMVEGFGWFEIYRILSVVFEIPSDKIDVVELNECSSIIAHYVARDGKLLYEKEPDLFEQFKQKALMSDTQLKSVCHSLRKNIELSLQRRGI